MKGTFQVIIIVVCIALAVVGILVFSGVIPLGGSSSSTGAGTVVLWGTVRTDVMGPVLDEFNRANPTFTVQYVQKSADTFDQDLLEALAENAGPDIFFLPDNLAFHYANKIFTIPYASYPLATFNRNFAGAGEVFLTSQGVMAFPLTIDPLVMYYNRSMLSANSVVYPPATWDDLTALVPTLTKKDDSNKILKSAVAIGQFSNIVHAKDILTAMFMQGGNFIVSEKDGKFNSSLNNGSSDAASFLKFYTDFSDPLKSIYSWNKSFPSSTDAFSREDAAFYFGRASELQSLVNRNPNQNFLVAPFPQIKNANFKLTNAHVMGLAISSSSKNFDTAYIAVNQMAHGTFAAELAAALHVAPARLDLLADKPTDAYSPVFYNSALYARSWLDPASRDTDNIFRTMIDSVLANTLTPAGAITDANSKLNLLLSK